MKRSIALPIVVPLLLVMPVGFRVATRMRRPAAESPASPDQAREGRELFLHTWIRNDPMASGGDGLGPVFNAASCVACHKQGGTGGGGPLENNVNAFMVRDGGTSNVRQGVVHSFATNSQFEENLSQVSGSLPSVCRPPLSDLLAKVTNSSCVQVPKIGAPGVNISQRNTPALFGANLIDAIPDRLIIANERKQRLTFGLADSDTEDQPVGRALRLANGHVGKFGWKAQIGTLGDFVRAACANELGLGNPSQPQPAPLSKPAYRSPALDLTDGQCDELTAFVASLPRPVDADSKDPHVAAGKRLFNTTGCADCHVPDVGDAKGIYSDLLLHRMARDLSGGGSYGDPPLELPEQVIGEAPTPNEWRTPPLWGVGDSAPYMHDGRAASLRQAIGLHGGQGALSAERFQNLRSSEQSDLLEFLRQLRAPKQDEPAPPQA